MTLLAAVSVGFGTSALLLAVKGNVGAAELIRLVALSGVLALAMLSVGVLISTWTRKAGAALGTVIFLWLALVFLGDVGLMGSTLVFKLEVADLFGLSLLNPLQVFKMAALGSVHASLDVLGPAGLYAVRTYGGALGWIFGGVLAGWVLVPLGLSYLFFCLRGDV